MEKPGSFDEWSGGPMQLHRCLHHPDLLRVDALDPDQAGKDPAA